MLRTASGHVGGPRGPRVQRLLRGCAALVLVTLVAACQSTGGPDTSEDTAGSGSTSSVPKARPAPDEPSPPATDTAPSPSPSPTPSVPATGSGRFATARTAMAPVGQGTPMRYRVQVEDSLELSAQETAQEINEILADPRGWTVSGQAFQLVASEPAELTIRVASPGTVDALCGAAGLDTGGEVNCAVGTTVVVNLKRWLLGSPQFDGALHDYRALIVNHEVGHRLGRGHEGCSGPGRLAPVMMQQIKGLHGCKANAWPYDREGTYVSGPPVA
ncbi:DUF3152 domain-containing protein [Streptomyces sp. NPDC094143]|uniref:DUF3152 domain-containing protein n=1 Tax=Streptomyces sp. NPDC094143 TaxID=3155310 RepID=UPI0033298033